MYKSINEGLSLTKNSLATARAGAEQFVDIATEFAERLAFAQGDSLDHADVIKELEELVGRMDTVVQQATFNGDNLIDGDNGSGATTRTVVTGVTRAGGFGATTIEFDEVNLVAIKDAFDEIVTTDLAALAGTPDVDQPILEAALEAAEL